MFESYGIAWHEREHGRFCDESAKLGSGVDMLLEKCAENHVTIQLHTNIDKIVKHIGFDLHSNQGVFTCKSLVVATGGLSIPKMGAGFWLSNCPSIRFEYCQRKVEMSAFAPDRICSSSVKV